MWHIGQCRVDIGYSQLRPVPKSRARCPGSTPADVVLHYQTHGHRSPQIIAADEGEKNTKSTIQSKHRAYLPQPFQEKQYLTQPFTLSTHIHPRTSNPTTQTSPRRLNLTSTSVSKSKPAGAWALLSLPPPPRPRSSTPPQPPQPLAKTPCASVETTTPLTRAGRIPRLGLQRPQAFSQGRRGDVTRRQRQVG